MQPPIQSAVIDFLNLLLECERAGAKALRSADTLDIPADIAPMLARHFNDEARYCAGLKNQIIRLGGRPSTQTGAFLEQFTNAATWAAKLDLLIRGQHWVAKRIGEKLPVTNDTVLTAFLVEMQATHITNVEEARLATGAPR
jgi:nitronate monooxygenase